ncbi:hypothetical protein ACFLV5_05180 [Chloroflexota bacterium]
MTRRLVPLRRIIEDIEDQGGDPDALFANPNDIAELSELDEEDQEEED